MDLRLNVHKSSKSVTAHQVIDTEPGKQVDEHRTWEPHISLPTQKTQPTFLASLLPHAPSIQTAQKEV